MADDESTTDETTDTETETGERELAGAALHSTLKKERAARREAEKANREMAAKLKKIEDAQLSETERLRQEADEARQRADELERQHERERTARTRSDTVRRVAKDFADPEDAIALLASRGELDSIEDERDAERALKALAKEKPHLLKQQGSKPTGIEQVLRNGEALDAQRTVEDALGLGPKTGEEMYAMTDEQFVAWRKADPEGYRKSVEGWTGNETIVRPQRTAAIRQ